MTRLLLAAAAIALTATSGALAAPRFYAGGSAGGASIESEQSVVLAVLLDAFNIGFVSSTASTPSGGKSGDTGGSNYQCDHAKKPAPGESDKDKRAHSASGPEPVYLAF